MNTYYKKFITTNVLVTFLIGVIGAILFYTVLPDWYHPAMAVILLTAFIINLIAFRIILSRKDAAFNIMLAITKSFGIKFFSYIALVVVLFLVEETKPHLISLVAFIFILYLIYTFLEVKAFSEYAKQLEK